MKKTYAIIVLSICLLFINTIYSQAGDTDPSNVSLPTFIPRSPEAATLGKYGFIANNSSTGQMNYSIPIYTIPLRSSNWNVSLAYNYGGFILEGKPSMNGLGWSLLASGVVNREVRGLADESQFGYYGLQSQRSIVENYVTTGTMTLTQLRDKFGTGEWDSEPDKYTVSVAGLNFSFKLDANKQPVFLSKHANKVTIDWSTTLHYRINSFTVTDINGVKYTFSTKERSVPKGYEEVEERYTDVSWLLSNVTYPNGEQLNFVYAPMQQLHSYDFTASGASTYIDPCYFPIQNPTDPSPYTNTTCGQRSFLAPNYQDNTSESIVERRTLSHISFPTGIIYFNRTLKNNRYLYNTIQVKDNQNNSIEEYSFEYFGQRDLLTKIDRKGKSYFEFEYYNQTDIFPAFLNSVLDKALNKDKWGYYNKATNQYALNIPNSQYVANLDPNYIGTRMGALKKITYPTRGTTTIEYEQNQIKTDNVINSDYYATVALSDTEKVIRLDGDYGDFTAPHYKESVGVLTFDYPTVAEMRHIISGTRSGSHILMRIYRDDSCPYNLYYPSNFSFETVQFADYNIMHTSLRNAIQQYNNGNINSTLNPTTPYMCPTLGLEYGPDDVDPGDHSQDIVMGDSGGRFIFMPGTYYFKIETTMNRQTNAYGEIRIRLQKNRNVPPPQFANIDVGGIRVSKFTDCADTGANCYERTYNYNDANGLSTGVLNVIPYKELIVHRDYIYSQPENNHPKDVYSYSTEFYSALNPSFGSPVYYSTIKEIKVGGENNGYNLKQFIAPNDIVYAPQHPKVPTGQDLTKAKLIKDENYKYVPSNNSYELVQSSESNYKQFRGVLDPQTFQDQNPNHPWGLKVGFALNATVDFSQYNYDLYPSGQAEIDAVKRLYSVSTYKELDSDYKVKSTTNKQILNGNEIEERQDIEYDYTNYQVKKSTKTTSDNKQLVSKITYPLNLSNPTFDEQKLIDANQIATPIKVAAYRIENGNEKLLSTKYTSYKYWGNGLVLPDTILSAKGLEKLKSRVIFHSYYPNGNAKELSKTDGTKIVYIWGYHQVYPIAKIENANFSDIPASLYNEILTKSDQDNDNCRLATCKEEMLRQALNKLRNPSLAPNLANAMITSFTYDPLIGVTSITDPGGNTAYYQYDSLNRLQFTENKDGEVLEEYKYNFKLEEIVASTTSSATTVTSGQNVTFTTSATGGTGNFTYKWIVSNANLNQVFNTSTGSLTVTTTANHAPNFTVTCEVKDVETDETLTTTTQVNVTTSFQALVVGDITYTSGSTYVGKNITHTISLSGGSGNYKYSWSKVNSQTILNIGTTTTSNTTNSRSARITSQDCSYYTVRCTVKDLTTNETVVKTKRIFIASGCSSGGGGGIR